MNIAECVGALLEDPELAEFVEKVISYHDLSWVLKERFLRWLEAVSLLGKLSDGIQSVQRLRNMAKVFIPTV